VSTLESGEADDRPAGLIGSADNVLTVLRMFQERRHIRGSEVSEAMGISRSTASRMLSTLQHHGFVERDPISRGFRPGPALIEIGLAALRDLDSPTALHSALVALKEATRETTHLAVLRGTTVVYIDYVESDQMVRTGSRIGWTLPAHAAASGKALLALYPDDEVRRLYAGSELSPAQLDALIADLGATRTRGYGLNLGETESDLGAVGVALPTRRERMALVVTAPLSRVDDAWVTRAGAAARQIASELATRPV
jgi:IclR family acetate operon transcriptional repressor